jgi:hypothetical protein
MAVTRTIKQYDIVRITGIRGNGPQGLFGRPPLVGDTACVVEIFAHTPRLGYALECVSPDGRTEWLASFAADEVTVEYLRNALG